MLTLQPPAQERLVLNAVTWKEYSRLLQLLGPRPLRLTFDRGTLEIMTLAPEHERLKHLLRRMLESIAEELGIALAGFGSMTCRRKSKRRGLEPDECYWISNEASVRGKDRIDLRRDPPPDLAIEVDVTHSSLDRLSIYAGLGVREVWRLEEQSLTIYVLQENSKYLPLDSSSTFHGLKSADLMTFLALRSQEDETSIVRRCREWTRKNLKSASS
jgi:Uma2 family endonuclease